MPEDAAGRLDISLGLGEAGLRRVRARHTAAVGRTEAWKDEWHGRSTAPPADSLGQRVENDEASLKVASVCFGAAGVVGDSTASAEAVAAMVDRGRERERGEMEQVSEERAGGGSSLTTSGQHVERGQGGMGGTTTAWRQCHGHGEKKKEKRKLWKPPWQI